METKLDRTPTVYVVDDDTQLRDALALLLTSVGLPVDTFASSEVFLDRFSPDWAGCLVLDVRLPGMSGLELQRQLARQGARIPRLILTAHADVPMAVQAMQAGAVDFIEKPFRPHLLLEKIQAAVKLDAQNRRERTASEQLRARFDTLSQREREVMDGLIADESSKAIAVRLGVRPATVDFHRRNILAKVGARSLVTFGRLYESSLGH